MSEDVAALRAQLEQAVRVIHHYGYPPDVRLQEDVDSDVEQCVDYFDRALAQLRADLAALVPLARAMVTHLKMTATATDLRQLAQAEAVLATYDKEGT